MPKPNGISSTAPLSTPAPSESASKPNGPPSTSRQYAPVTAKCPSTINGAAAAFQPGLANGPVAVKPSSNAQSVGQPTLSPRPPPSPVVQHSSNPVVHNTPVAAPQVPPNTHVEPNGNIEKEDSSSAGVVKLDTSSHSSHQSNKAAEQSWETDTTNSYVPAAIAVPWGEETFQQPPLPQYEQQTTFSRRNNGNNNRRQPRQEANGGRTQKHLPKQFEGSWDEMVQSEKRSAQGSSSPRQVNTSISSASTKSTDFSNAFTRQVVTKPEPNPQARPVCSPIALNKSDQRIDLKLPRPVPADEEAFKLRTKNRHLCNEHHMRGICSDTQCTFDHEEISDGVYLALRNKAHSVPCNQGSGCRRHDCYFAHHCPNISRASACGRINCPFKSKGLHSILDLDIVEMNEPPKEETLI